jgi:hypothetical protein
MRNKTPDGKDIREIIEAALEGQAAVAASDAHASPGTIVGELIDTHNPHLPGRVLVRWLTPQGQDSQAWVQVERHLSLRKGDRVLLTLPMGWQQWVVTGVLGRENKEPVEEPQHATELRLAPGQNIRILAHDGSALVTVKQGPDGAVVELGNGNVELKAARTLRLTADTIEIQAAQGGVDLRTEGDAVVRARTIRLN